MTTNYYIDIENMELISDDRIDLSKKEKELIVKKLLEAHKLALANFSSGNITHRGFAANICDNNNNWALGTNFNNTRNEISSICAERSAILSLYNSLLIEYMQKNKTEKFDFKIKYICMAQNIPLDKTATTPPPCEDCLSWLNTNRFFDNKTIIFSFEKNKNNTLALRAIKLSSLLPYKDVLTSTDGGLKKIVFANDSIKLSEKEIYSLIEKTCDLYKNNKFAFVSNQNISCSILVNNEIFSASKIDWTKRWFLEPLEFACAKAIEKYGNDLKIDAVCYFGDEYSKNNEEIFFDGTISIKSLGRIRRKYAKDCTPLILNLKDSILVTTIAQYLPKKFIQGYKI